MRVCVDSVPIAYFITVNEFLSAGHVVCVYLRLRILPTGAMTQTLSALAFMLSSRFLISGERHPKNAWYGAFLPRFLLCLSCYM